MNYQVISGTDIANNIYNTINTNVSMSTKTPGLAIIMVGGKKESMTYVNIKKNKCKKYGLYCNLMELDDDVSDDAIILSIMELNNDISVHGIIVQLPLPPYLNSRKILDSILPEKDVDGLGTFNMGKLLSGDEPYFYPCTPEGCMSILNEHRVQIEGAHAVIIGCSNIVGKPMGIMLINKEATVTMCHKKTENIQQIVQMADILIVACGVPELVKGDWVKEGAFVIDVGINYITDTTSSKGYRITGDVDFEEVSKKAHTTPVPGGVGPMTVSTLLSHVTNAARQC